MTSWIIQSSGLKRTDEMNLDLVKALDNAGVKWADFGLPFFTTEITNHENFPVDDAYFPNCSTKALRLFTENKVPAAEMFIGHPNPDELLAKIRRGTFYDVDRFDMANYIDEIGNLLNQKAQVMTLREFMETSFEIPMFVKPSQDLKLFSAGEIPRKISGEQYLETIQRDGSLLEQLDTRVIVSDLIDIHAEWRFFVVDGYIAGQSQYRKHGLLKWDKYVPEYVSEQAQRLVDNYWPAKCFVMDVALTEDLELEIVEYNCINCSGFYHIDVKRFAHIIGQVI